MQRAHSKNISADRPQRIALQSQSLQLGQSSKTTGHTAPHKWEEKIILQTGRGGVKKKKIKIKKILKKRSTCPIGTNIWEHRAITSRGCRLYKLILRDIKVRNGPMPNSLGKKIPCHFIYLRRAQRLIFYDHFRFFNWHWCYACWI